MRLSHLILAAAGGVCLLGGTGCALRATTDFGPQSDSTKQSVSGGANGLRGIPLLGSGDPPGGADDRLNIGESPFSSEGGAVGSGGGHP